MVGQNPTGIRAYYNEDIDRSAPDVRDELKESVNDIDGVTDVTVTDVWASSRPIEAQLTVEFDEADTDSSTVEFDISCLSFLHNAQQNR